MLLRFRFSNIRSFRTEQELSLIAGTLTGTSEGVRHPEAISEGVLPAAAIYGANASGKTNVLRALAFLSEAVTSSYRHWEPDGPIPREAFLADDGSELAPSSLELDFLSGGIRHRYGLRVDSSEVLEEWLHVYPRGKKQTWFHRVKGHPISFGTKMAGENRTIEGLTRKNCLFLSAAAQNNHENLLPVYRWTTGLQFVLGNRTVYRQHTAELCAAQDYLDEVTRLVSAADLGISGLTIDKEDVPDALMKARSVLKSLGREIEVPEPPLRIRLLHRFGKQEIPFSAKQESQGTLAYLALLGPVIDALKNGVPLCVDELDGSLHPLLSAQLIRLFNDPSTNPKGAQLIFNTQDTNLLSSGLLRRDQIWFTEKKDDASTHLFPLSDFRPRRAENLENGYLQGRYGAIPFINPDSFLSRFKEEDVKE